MSFLRGWAFLVIFVGVAPGQAARGESQPAPEKTQPVRTDLYGDALPPGAIGRLGTVRFRHSGPVHCIAFSPDGKTLASGGVDAAVRLWEIATGKEIRQFKGEAYLFEAVAFSPGDKVLAAASFRVIYLWDVASGKEIGRLKGHDQDVSALAFSGDGKRLASASEDKTLRLWDVEARRQLGEFKGHDAAVNCVALSADGHLLASGSEDFTVRTWESDNGREIHRFRLGTLEDKDSGRVPAVAISRDGKFLAAAANHYKKSAEKWQAKVVLWDVASGKELRSFHNKAKWIGDLYFIQGGKVLAANVDGIVRFAEVASGKETRAFPVEGSSIVFSPDEQYLASASHNAVRIWNATTGQEQHPFAGHGGNVEFLTISPDGKTLVSGSDDHTGRVWDMATGKELRAYGEDDPNGIRVRAISPDCKTLAWDVFGGDVIHLMETASGKEIGCLQKDNEKGKTVYGIFAAFSPNGKTLAEKESLWDKKSENWSDRLRLWDISTGKEIRRFFEGKGLHSPVFFSPDGKTLAAQNRRWEVATGKELPHLGDEDSFIHAFSPDGKILASWEDLSIRLFRLAWGKELFRLPPRTGAIAFSPDGKSLAGRSHENKQIVLWELASGLERGRFLNLTESPESPQCFSPDGTLLASGNDDTTIILWDVTGLRSPGPQTAVQLSPKELDALWAKLADGDAAKAYRAIWRLAASAQQALPFLKMHLKPVVAADPHRIGVLLTNLNHESFGEREKATKQLEELEELAAPALRKLISGKPHLEVQRRAERLLGQLDGILTSPERLRSLRAIEVLEHICTPEAQDVLRTLAKGGPEARLTQEAKASLERLAKRAALRP